MGPLTMKISFGKLTFDTWMQEGLCLVEEISTTWVPNFIVGKKKSRWWMTLISLQKTHYPP
jgi:hypothetical protein